MKIFAKTGAAQKMKFSIKDLFSKCDQIRFGKLHFLFMEVCDALKKGEILLNDFKYKRAWLAYFNHH